MNVYTKEQVDVQARIVGERLKDIKSDIPTITQTTGQSTTEVVSQKLLTDTIGDIESVLDTINGVSL